MASASGPSAPPPEPATEAQIVQRFTLMQDELNKVTHAGHRPRGTFLPRHSLGLTVNALSLTFVSRTALSFPPPFPPQLQTQIFDLEQQLSDHKLVLGTLTPMDAGRRCMRMIGGVLVERTVGEVVPAVQARPHPFFLFIISSANGRGGEDGVFTHQLAIAVIRAARYHSFTLAWNAPPAGRCRQSCHSFILLTFNFDPLPCRATPTSCVTSWRSSRRLHSFDIINFRYHELT